MLILRSLFTVTQKNSPADTENRICRRVFYKYIFRQADILKSPPAAYCFSQLKQETYLIRLIFSISKDHCIRFPYSGISLCTFLYFLKYTGICFYSAFINSRMISRMISSSSGESILLKWLPVAAV